MKISLVCPASLPATPFGGILFLGVHIASKLSDEGNEVTIYTSDLDFSNNESFFNKSLPNVEKIKNFTIKRTHVFWSIYLFFINPGMYFQMLHDSHDVIHIIGIRSFQALIGTLISKKKNIPLIISDQGGLTTHPDIKNSSVFKKFLIKLQTPMIKFIVNQADLILAANEYEKKIFLNFCNSDKIKIVKNGIDLKELEISKIDFKKKYSIKNNYVLFLGRFHKVKGVDVFLHSINLIKNNPLVQNLDFVIFGADFGYEKEMMKLIDKLGINGKIHVIKNSPRTDAISAYNECKFLVLPSRWELSPLTPLEGFAFKKAVISTTAHGIPYTLKNRKNSILVTPSDPHELANAILELLTDSILCEKLGEYGNECVVKQQNSDNMVKEIFQVYLELEKSNKFST